MFMLVNERPNISCANDVEMWVWKEKKNVHFFKWGYRILFLANWGEIKKNIIRVKFSFNFSFSGSYVFSTYIWKLGCNSNTLDQNGGLVIDSYLHVLFPLIWHSLSCFSHFWATS